MSYTIQAEFAMALTNTCIPSYTGAPGNKTINAQVPRSFRSNDGFQVIINYGKEEWKTVVKPGS